MLVAEMKILPHLRNRPMTVERFPEGVADDAPHFWQKHTPTYYPKWIPRIRLKSEDGRPVDYLLVNDKPTLLYLVNQNVITFHPFLSTLDDLDTPTYVLFDVDPHQSTFANAIKVAKHLKKELDAANTESFIKTTGKSGLHVLTSWTKKQGGYDAARTWAAQIAEQVTAALPNIVTTERRIESRGRRVYLDVIQNARGHHAVAPYTVRPTPTATVSTPLKWSELTSRLNPKKFTMKEVLRRTKGKPDPMLPLT